MIEGKFDLVFRGQTIKSVELDQVKANLAVLFKSSPEAIEKLFTGNEVPVRRGLDYTTAMKYQSALKKAGALALIKDVESPANEPMAKPSSQGKATFDVSESPTSEGNAQPVARAASVTHTPVEKIAESAEPKDSLTIADAGAQIMPNKVYEKREVDTSDLSLAAAGERIMPKKAPDNIPPPSIDHLRLE